MTDVARALAELHAYAAELDTLSKNLTEIDRRLEKVQAEVDEFTDNYELALYTRSVEDDGYKLPSEAIRAKLARRAMPPELYGQHVALTASRDRMKRRIGDLKSLCDTARSIVSAEKVAAEASGYSPGYSSRRAVA